MKTEKIIIIIETDGDFSLQTTDMTSVHLSTAGRLMEVTDTFEIKVIRVP